MKKAIALILSVAMLMSLLTGCRWQEETTTEATTAPVAAENEAPTQTEAAAADSGDEKIEETPAMPETADELIELLTNESAKIVALYSPETVQDLSEDIWKRMEEAAEKLSDVDAEGLARRYFFFTDILSDEDSASVDFDQIPHNTILFMQYIDSMWVPLEHTVDEENGIITIPTVAENPIVIFTDPVPSIGGSNVELLPILSEDSYLVVQIHSLDEVAILSEENQKQMADAKDALQDVCPEGFAVKYFFFLDVLGNEASANIGVMPFAHNEILFMQYVDGAWVVLEYTKGEGGVMAIDGAVEAPFAIFVK